MQERQGRTDDLCSIFRGWNQSVNCEELAAAVLWFAVHQLVAQQDIIAMSGSSESIAARWAIDLGRNSLV